MGGTKGTFSAGPFVNCLCPPRWRAAHAQPILTGHPAPPSFKCWIVPSLRNRALAHGSAWIR
eukprot:1133271-Alexandrium_andersonii.AAC.1